MTFRGTPLPELLVLQEHTRLVLECIVEVWPEEDVPLVNVAGVLGALEAELRRRDQIARRVCDAVRDRVI